MQSLSFSGLDLLTTAIIALDQEFFVKYVNPAAENLFELSSRNFIGRKLDQLFHDTELLYVAIHSALAKNSDYTEHDVQLSVRGHLKRHLSCTLTPTHWEDVKLVIECRPIDQQRKIVREERLLIQNQANRELMRNLAHEIKNPLGGIRGAAQLLERELGRPELTEYTQVIIKEADRLQVLMDRLLTPHRLPRHVIINLHEVLERVRTLILSEYPEGLKIHRDYDTSLPALRADMEQLIQAVLNIARNAAQALQGQGTILLKTRIARQVTLARKRHRLALVVQIIDDGPGIPESIRDRIFYPLVSGREHGSGLGLTLAQEFIGAHEGTIEWESMPGNTCFTILLPVASEAAEATQDTRH